MFKTQQRAVRLKRFSLKHIQSSPGNNPLIQGACESGLVNYPAPPEIEQHRAALHLAQLSLTYKAARTVVKRRVDTYDIGSSKQLIQRQARIVLVVGSA